MNEITQEQRMKMFYMFIKTIRNYAENDRIKEYGGHTYWSDKYNTKVTEYTIIIDEIGDELEF